MSLHNLIEYASAPPASRSSIWGGVALLGAGLGLILLGGCFLIGILTMHGPLALQAFGGPSGWPLPLLVLPWVLYLLAFGCFAGAAWMLIAGVRWLYNAA